MDGVKRVENPGAVVLYEGRLARVVSIGEGRTITLHPIDATDCPVCGVTPLVVLLEHSPLFQERVEPIETVAIR